MSTSNIQGEIRSFLIDKAGLADSGAGDDTVIVGNGLVDSFGLVALLAEVEQKFGVFPDLMSRDPSDFATVGGMARIVLEAMDLPPEAPAEPGDAQKGVSEEDMKIQRLNPSHPLWADLPGLFLEMFDHFSDCGLKLPLAPGGDKLWLQSLERLPEAVSLVAGAIQGNQLIGFASGHCKMLPAHLGGGLIGEISYVYVTPTQRNAGVAGQLIDRLEHWFQDRNVRSTELQVLVDNSTARSFWQKRGFVEELIQMRK
jgi:ribosomal protein S18 acetylase RimI-like enzyme